MDDTSTAARAVEDDPAVEEGPAVVELPFLYPDDPDANRFTTDLVVLRCSHEHDHPSGVRKLRSHGDDGSIEGPLHVVSSSTSWPNGVEPDEVLVLTSEPFPQSRTSRLDTPSESDTDWVYEPVPDGVVHAGRQMHAYKLTCASPVIPDSVTFLHRQFWDLLSQGIGVRLLNVTPNLHVQSYYPHQFVLEITAPALRSVKQSNKVEVEINKFGEERDRLRTDYDRGADSPAEARRRQRDASSVSGRAADAANAYDAGLAAGWVEEKVTIESANWSPLQGSLRESVDRYSSKTGAGGAPPSRRGTVFSTGSQGIADSVSFEADGEKVEFAGAKVLHGFLEIGYAIEHWSEVLKDVPKAGWYWDLTASFFKGKVAVGWGWREHHTHEAYFWAGFEIDVTLIEVSVEIGIGVSGFGAEALVFAEIAGSLGIKVAAERTGPDELGEFRAGVEGEIRGRLGARMKVPFLFKAEANGETKLQLDRAALVFNDRTGFSFGGDIKWTGLKGTLKASVAVSRRRRGVQPVRDSRPYEETEGEQVSHESSAQWVDPVTLGSFQWPGTQVDDEALAVDEIQRVVEDYLSGSKRAFFDRVLVEDQQRFGDDQMSRGQVAGHIAGRIDAQPGIRKDLPSISRIADAVHHALARLASSRLQRADDEWHDRRLSLTKTRFYEFVTDGELDVVITGSALPFVPADAPD